jgi:hypothetical protein
MSEAHCRTCGSCRKDQTATINDLACTHLIYSVKKKKNSRHMCGVKHVRFEAYTAVLMKFQIFWDVTPYYALLTSKWHVIPENLNLESQITFTE